MSGATAAEQQQERTPAVREGSRWTHGRPTAEEVTDWFGDQPLHDGMEDLRERYLGGIVLIPAKEKAQELRRNQAGNAFIFEFELPVFTPYVKVDTRVAYFWDYVRVLNDRAGEEKYTGTIKPVKQRVIEDPQSPYFNANLPEGYGVIAVRQAPGGNDGGVARFLVATFEAAIWEKRAYAARLRGDEAELPVLRGIGSKQTAILKRNGYADEFAVMKCETGAVGRALGMAGILVVGTGVASAEDMQEMDSAQAGAAPEQGPQTPAVVGPAVVQRSADADMTAGGNDETQVLSPEQVDAQFQDQLRSLTQQLREQHPEAYQSYIEWWQERGHGAPDDLKGPALKGAVTKLGRVLDEARRG